jgi:hypothetical protein
MAARAAALSLAATLAFFAAPSPAAADDTSDCIAASEAAQSLRDRRALRQARDKLSACSRDVCPGPIRADCIQQAGEVDAAMPSVVLRAKDARGEDLLDVKVFCDGVALATQVDGKAQAMDPGAHTFRFEAQRAPPVTRKLVLGDGEKNRLVVAQMASGSPSPAAAGPTVTGAPDRGVGGRLSIPGLVAGAIGVAAAVPMAVLWISTTSDIGQMKSSCAPSAGGAGCPADRVDSDHTKLIVGDVFLGIAAASVATAAVLLFTHRGAGAKEAHTARGLQRLDASPIPGGAFVSAAARF